MEENQKKMEATTADNVLSPTDEDNPSQNNNEEGEKKMILDDDNCCEVDKTSSDFGNDNVSNKRSPSQQQEQQQKRRRVSETSPSSGGGETTAEKDNNETKLFPASSSITTTTENKEENNNGNNANNRADTNGIDIKVKISSEGQQDTINSTQLNQDETKKIGTPCDGEKERIATGTSSEVVIEAADNNAEKSSETPNNVESPKKEIQDDTANMKIENNGEKINSKESSVEGDCAGNNGIKSNTETKDMDLDTDNPTIQDGEVSAVPVPTSKGDEQKKPDEKIVNENTEDNNGSSLETKGINLAGEATATSSNNKQQADTTATVDVAVAAKDKKHSDDNVATDHVSLTGNKKEEEGEDGNGKNTSDDKNSSRTSNGNTRTQTDGKKNKNDSEKPAKTQSSPTKSKRKKKSKKDIDPKVYEIRWRIQIGCRDNDLKSALQAYEDAMKNDIRVEAQSFYNLLNLCDGLERSVHAGTPSRTSPINSGGEEEVDKKPAAARATKEQEPIDPLERRTYAFQIMDHMSKLNLPLTESAYTAIMRILSRTKDFTKAEEVLNDAEKVQQCKPKLRLYSCLLIAYCDDNKMELALKVWKRLSSKGLQETEKELLALMKCANNTGNAQVMEAVMTDLAEEVAVPSKDSIATTLEWFDSYHASHQKEKLSIDDSHVQEVLREIHSRAATTSVNSMGPVVNNNGWQISSAVQIDTETGTLKSGCLVNCKLKPVPLSDSDWKKMAELNETILIGGQISQHKSVYQGGGKGKKQLNFSAEKRKGEWDRFNKFLDDIATSGGRTLDVVIDGANVGYFKQNFGKAPRVEYYQIDWVVQHFLKLGKRILVFMHERHFANNGMPDKYRHLQRKWENDGVLYKTPAGMNDDWFWLHAAWKFKALVLTNDQMRDHHFQMLSPRIFLRWRERHQIYFDFGEKWEGRNGKKVELVYPPVYSRRIQRVANGIVLPLAKRGDENRYLDGYVVASSDEPEEETYLCIRPI